MKPFLTRLRQVLSQPDRRWCVVQSCAVLVAAFVFAGAVHAADPVKPSASPGATEEAPDPGAAGKPAPRDSRALEFAPPPVPEFMLRKPDKPLTLEQMRRQAEEAAEKSRRTPAPAAQDSPR